MGKQVSHVKLRAFVLKHGFARLTEFTRKSKRLSFVKLMVSRSGQAIQRS